MDNCINQDYKMVTPILVRPKRCGGVPPEDLEIAVLKTYPFESRERRMTVIARRRITQYFDVYMKGAPETVVSYCSPDTGTRLQYYK